MHDKTLERSVAEIAETLKNKTGATLLIGAGCSASAGIPLASEFVRLISDKFPARCKRLGSANYAQLMDELGDGERHDVIAPKIDASRVNWAHMAIAQLMKHGYVSRILTTNFDPLIIKACAIAGIFPAVYDLASSDVFKPAQVRDPSVFYLHGQRLGFVMLNTDKQVGSHFDTLKPVFDRAGEGRVWIVAGYSGANDPVFKHLAEVEHFGHNLYWVGYRDEEPAPHVAGLISKQRCAYYVSGYDADGFFVELARALDCFPPDIISKPFSHLIGFLDLLMPFSLTPESSQDLREAARTRIQKAIDAFETGETSADVKDLRPEALDATSLLFSGKTDEVLALYEASSDPSDELREAVAWAHISVGNSLFEQAKVTGGKGGEGAEVDRLWQRACSRYADAVRIKPDKHEALYNWGTTIAAWARTKMGEEASRLWEQACRRYADAVRIKPDMYEALNNWSIALLHRAALAASPKIRTELLKEAEEKCRKADALVPGHGSYNLACVYAGRNDAENCRLWLLRSKEHNRLPARDHVLSDPDLAPFRDETWFREIVATS